jgi:putative endonuclease
LSRAKGFAAEDTAVAWLERHGFEIIERNWTQKTGEIDVIAQKNEVIHFIEVKSGRSFDPIYAFNRAKLGRVIKTAELWLQKRRVTLPFCIDALSIRADTIELFENVTL